MGLKSIAKQLKQVICIGIIAFLLCSAAIFGGGAEAVAGESAAGVIQDRAERAFDEAAGAGTVNQIKGKVKESIGGVQRQVDSQVDGAAKQAAGRAQKDLGRAQEAVEDATNAAQDSAEGIVDSVKDFFGQ